MRPRTMHSLYHNKSVAYIFKIHMVRSKILWTRTLGRYTCAGHHERVLGKILGPSPESTQGSTQRTHTHTHTHTPSPLQKLKKSDPTGNLTSAAGQEDTCSKRVIIYYVQFFTFPTVRIRASAPRKQQYVNVIITKIFRATGSR